MTRNQGLIIAVLGFAVILVYCVGGVLIVQQVLKQTTQVADVPTTTPEAAPIPIQSATRATTALAPFYTPTTLATPTWVMFLPPTPTSAALDTTRATTQAASSASGPLATVWNRSNMATVYRFEFDMSMKGELGGLSGLGGANQELSLFTISGEVNNKNTRMTLKGWLGMFFGGDATKGFEMMVVGNKTYLRGPAPMLGAPENKWYVSTTQFKTSVPQADRLLDSSGSQNVDWSAFRKIGSETLDGRRCDVYSADKAATFALFTSLDMRDTPGKDVLNQLDNAEAKSWVCDDGYLHQVWMSLEGHDKDKPTEKISFQMRIHLFDFNGNVKIVAPTNAVPLQAPFLGIVTSTPTPKK